MDLATHTRRPSAVFADEIISECVRCSCRRLITCKCMFPTLTEVDGVQVLVCSPAEKHVDEAVEMCVCVFVCVCVCVCVGVCVPQHFLP